MDRGTRERESEIARALARSATTRQRESERARALATLSALALAGLSQLSERAARGSALARALSRARRARALSRRLAGFCLLAVRGLAGCSWLVWLARRDASALRARDAIPYSALSGNPHCILVTTKTGGHLGWVFGDGAPFGHPWSDQTMLEWFLAVLKLNEGQLSRRQAGRASSPA
eukprot:gene8535-4878_t